MTTLGIIALIGLAIIGLAVLGELIAITIMLSRISKLVGKVHDKIDPVVESSTKVMTSVNDIADTVKTDIKKVSNTVTFTSEKVADVVNSVTQRVDRTRESVQSATATATQQLGSPPMLNALMLFIGLQLGSRLRRVLGWPLLAVLAVVAGIPTALRAWRSVQQPQMATVPVSDTPETTFYVPQDVEDTGDTGISRAA
jgi:uncharacterized protein YoxC